MYAYEFGDVTAPYPAPIYNPPNGDLVGASHTDELSYLFVNVPITPTQMLIADQMIGYWTNFAVTGNPNGKGLPNWPVYKPTEQNVLLITDPARAPDIGPARLHPTAGATIVGAVEEHDAYFNVVLDTTDLSIAKKLATYVRGRTGGFTNIQGVIGLPNTHRRTGKACVIVSCEISNPLKTPIHRVFDLLPDEAARYGVNVLAGQICGAVEAEVLVQTAEWYLKLEGINRPWDYKSQILENHLLELET